MWKRLLKCSIKDLAASEVGFVLENFGIEGMMEDFKWNHFELAQFKSELLEEAKGK